MLNWPPRKPAAVDVVEQNEAHEFQSATAYAGTQILGIGLDDYTLLKVCRQPQFSQKTLYIF